MIVVSVEEDAETTGVHTTKRVNCRANRSIVPRDVATDKTIGRPAVISSGRGGSSVFENERRAGRAHELSDRTLRPYHDRRDGAEGI